MTMDDHLTTRESFSVVSCRATYLCLLLALSTVCTALASTTFSQSSLGYLKDREVDPSAQGASRSHTPSKAHGKAKGTMPCIDRKATQCCAVWSRDLKSRISVKPCSHHQRPLPRVVCCRICVRAAG